LEGSFKVEPVVKKIRIALGKDCWTRMAAEGKTQIDIMDELGGKRLQHGEGKVQGVTRKKRI